MRRAAGLDKPGSPVVLPREYPVPTPRQQEILQLVARGRSQARIAGDLGLEYITVKFHMGELYRRWRVTGAAEAVAVGLEQGFILPPGVADGP